MRCPIEEDEDQNIEEDEDQNIENTQANTVIKDTYLPKC